EVAVPFRHVDAVRGGCFRLTLGSCCGLASWICLCCELMLRGLQLDRKGLRPKRWSIWLPGSQLRIHARVKCDRPIARPLITLQGLAIERTRAHETTRASVLDT